ncbi:DUF1656 domain-containing protein [Variovorax sp. JS1663]|uniref:DUF1656 domain-containing protein n=1 Tax=Variovorax sp. JS1663 TaxID=1851577 RepID=UPI000B344546|nr:DUF1656 domain-containing protein [Variovorax sp. JS1663]OUM02837.1 hypothetical protein A8M77_09575 [Variovorax sp. JS1663]
MMTDINFFGVFVDTGLITAMVAGLLLMGLRRLFAATGVYRWVWHPPLLDLSLFALLWFALATAAVHFQDHLVLLLG